MGNRGKNNKRAYSIGRSSECDIVIPDDRVSRRHATLMVLEDGTCELHDHQSHNGTYVNGHRINSKQLHSGDHVLLAKKIDVKWQQYATGHGTEKRGTHKPIQRLTPNTPARIFASLMLLLCVTGFFQFLPAAQNGQQARTDLAELQNIRYDLLNAEVWKLKIAEVIRIEIRDFDLSSGDREVLRKKIEDLLYTLIDRVHEIFLQNEDQSFFGSLLDMVRSFIADVVIDLDKIKRNVPQMADALLRELENPQSRAELANLLERRITSFIDDRITPTDNSNRLAICAAYGQPGSPFCVDAVTTAIEDYKTQGTNWAWLIALSAIALFLLLIYREGQLHIIDPVLRYVGLCALLLLLLAGVFTPMIDIDARITSLQFSVFSSEVSFGEQVLFFQSKSIWDIVVVLLKSQQGDALLVGVLVLLFSVIFPVLKGISLLLVMNGHGANSSPVQFLAFRSGKWSMADVMVVAILMAFIGLNSMVGNQLNQLSQLSEGVTLLTTNQTSLKAGFVLFTLFCIGSIVFSGLVQKQMVK